MAAAEGATHYEALGVTDEATDKEIKKAYRKLVMKCHPDKDPSPGAKERFVLIQRACDVLSDPLTRSKYDDALAAGGAELGDGEDDNPDHATALMLAAAAGTASEVAALLSQGASADEMDSFDRTALMYAASAGHTEVVEQLLGAKARLDLRDSEGMTPFLCAAGGRRKVLELRHGAIGCLRDLLDAKADVNESSLKGYTALSLACNGGSFVVVNFLLSSGALPDQCSAQTMSPLCIAAHRGHIKIMDRLIEATADPNAPAAGDGETALMVASGAGQEAAVELLLRHGAQAVLFMHDGGSALLSVVEEHTEGRVREPVAAAIVKQLLLQNADPLASTIDGRTPLKVAARNTAEHHRGAWLEDLLSSAAAQQCKRQAAPSCKDCLAGFRILFGSGA